MMVYAGNVGKLEYQDICRREGIGNCLLANHWQYPKEGIRWFLDNGAFHSWKNGKSFDGDAFRTILWKIEKCISRPDFIVCPDIVQGGLNSLNFSVQWLHEIPEGNPVYLAVQDGMIPGAVDKYISLFDGVFVGGSPDWKWKNLDMWVEFAHDRKLPAHVGRAGKFKDILMAKHAGADSIDSSTITQANRAGTFGQFDGFRRVDAANKQTFLEVLI